MCIFSKKKCNQKRNAIIWKNPLMTALFRTLQITVLYHRYFDGDIVSDHPQLFSVDIKTVVRFQNHQRARDVHPRCPTRHNQPRALIPCHCGWTHLENWCLIPRSSSCFPYFIEVVFLSLLYLRDVLSSRFASFWRSHSQSFFLFKDTHR